MSHQKERKIVPKIVALWFVVAVAASLPLAVCGQGFKPSRPIEAVVHGGPGASTDVFARSIAAMIEKDRLLPVRMQVINKTGGNSAVAMAYLAEKRGEGHTIAFFSGGWLQNPLVSAEARVTLRDLTPIARLALEPALIVIKPDLPFNTLKEFIDAATKNPGTLRQSGGSVTSRDNIVRQLLQKKTGARWSYISFPGGGERVAALLGGHVNMMVIEPLEGAEYIRAGTMRVLAQIADKRLPGFPNVPTMKEAGFDIPSVPQLRGVVAPPGLPKEVVAYWEDLFRRFAGTPAWKKYLVDNQFEDGYQSGADLSKFYEEYSKQMREIFRDAGVKVFH
jgi:putative tricarboxylic transport membrane protein